MKRPRRKRFSGMMCSPWWIWCIRAWSVFYCISGLLLINIPYADGNDICVWRHFFGKDTYYARLKGGTRCYPKDGRSAYPVTLLGLTVSFSPHRPFSLTNINLWAPHRPSHRKMFQSTCHTWRFIKMMYMISSSRERMYVPFAHNTKYSFHVNAATGTETPCPRE